MKLHDIPEQELFNLVDRLDVRGPRYTSYPTVPVWGSDFPAAPFVDALGRAAADVNPVALYVHLPFCKSRCLYCGCNSCITSDARRIGDYVDALIMEIERVAGAAGGAMRHAQLHLGGGTPTHTPPDMLAKLLDVLLAHFAGTADAERSVEVDPRVTTDEHLLLLAERGFRRISIGLQDLNADVQRAVRREYALDQLTDFLWRARKAGFTGINIDLIYGLPLQTRATWKTTLEQIVRLRPDRLACFGYAHLPQRIKHQRAIREDDLPAPRERLGMLLDANRFFTTHGYDAVGMDHFALPADDLAQARRAGRLWRNFMGYTTIRGMTLIGFGCSAISEFPDLFVQNRVPPEDYAACIRAGQWAVQRGIQLDTGDRVRKQIINHLMCNLQVEIPGVAQYSGNGETAELKAALESLRAYVADGLLIPTDNGFEVTELGQLFVRNLAMPFDRYLSQESAATFSRTV